MATATKSKSTSTNSKMENAYDLLVHEMADMRNAEETFLETLKKGASAATNDELRKGLEMHHEQTQGHIENLDAAFKELGEKPQEVECKGAKGLKGELDDAVKEKPAAEVLDTLIAGGAAKVEQYEITGYSGMVDLAKQLGHDKVAKLLSENLKEEEETLKKVEKMEAKLAKNLPAPSAN